MGRKTRLLKTLAKSQISAFIGSIVDFCVFFVLQSYMGVLLALATASGKAVGAVVNFLLNRHWTYKAGDKTLGPQLMRYVLISGTSLLLNTAGVPFVANYFNLDPSLAWLIVGLIVAIGFNFVMHKIFVFK